MEELLPPRISDAFLRTSGILYLSLSHYPSFPPWRRFLGAKNVLILSDKIYYEPDKLAIHRNLL